MDARELRIGNWVACKQCNCEYGYEQIDAIDIVRIHDGRISCIHPIELTEEILLKAGLSCAEKRRLGIWNNGDAIYFTCNSELDVELPYVHQLQNLMHALTGQELTINF